MILKNRLQKKRLRPATIVVKDSSLDTIPANQLAPGMYVAELDIPWEDSPFLFQGFQLKDWHDVDAVQKCSKSVVIDQQKTQRINLPRRQAENSAPAVHTTVTKNAVTHQEIVRAGRLHDNTSNLVHNIMNGIKLGKAIDTQSAREVVTETVDSMITAPDAMMMLTRIRERDDYTAQHSMNVAVLTIAFGRALKMKRERLIELGVCGLLHDMGKVLTPIEVLNKEGSLNEEEFEIMKHHPKDGRDILASSGGLFNGAIDVAHAHHERLDGSGYPRGLYAHQTTQWSKIVAITDVFDAITSDRCYKNGRTSLEAFRILNNSRGSKFDSNLVMRFIGSIGIYPAGTIVKLNSGESGIVIEANPKKALQPKVLIVRDAEEQLVQARLIDISEQVRIEGQEAIYKIVDTLHPSKTSIDMHELKNSGFLLDTI